MWCTRTRRSFVLLAGCLVALTVGVCTQPALAQRGAVSVGMRAGLGGGFAPPVSKADLKKFTGVLSLDDIQVETAEQLLAAMQSEHDVYAEKARKEIDRLRVEFQDSQDPTVFRDEMPKVMQAYTTGAAAVEKQFFDDLKSLLTPEQVEKWPKLERLHRRGKSLPNGMLSGESLDLIATVEQLKLPEISVDLAAVLDRYEADLDRALIERDKVRQERMPGAGGNGFNFDFEQIRKDMAELRKAGLVVCEVNQRYARSIEATLPEERRTEFASQVRKETFPRIYRDTHTGKCLKAAMEFKDLTDEQSSSIQDLLAGYERELKSVNSEWAEAQQALEADGGGDPFAMLMGGGENPAVADARKAKRELDKNTREKLLAILSEEQIERLPEREEDGPGMMFRIGG